MEVNTAHLDMATHLTLGATINQLTPYLNLAERFFTDNEFASSLTDEQVELLIARHAEATLILDRIMTGPIFNTKLAAIA